MKKRQLALFATGVLGIYVLACGGIRPLVSGGFADALYHLLGPLRTGSPLDAILGMASVLLLVWAALGDSQDSLGRGPLLRAVALGSAVMASVILLVNIFQAPSLLYPQFAGILALVAVTHAAVGFGAALLLALRRESRRLSPLPLVVTSLMVAATGVTAFYPVFA